ncbi:bifunctional folylpolyglutamate synthase/dihydrofolate synthase [Methylacidiphilum caldifontis]|uniref:Dihydrofolate synthase/folylpolyglutamate synthase n=1 Tax=Methylacidiphilum caldifontis TaxID=2795386 RepID=A0A4Y8PG69_9BACT|nr:folylpolyglutamate synthase/dihydrofolate synthase family protein [Methylacidiphilum caldifontis]QSR88307.1 bifunctional folylpolyglutamate synthase/dihydrofolate synthase [Methylacidiphilum caldifontis]TFE70618.1 bifunctional folylpolyglutamate synthase/dihydrofolate synthase [Methylacidiphilum caldifontis]
MNSGFAEEKLYREALQFLGQTRKMGMKLGLQNIERLAQEMGNPHKNLNFIHIAGTNGKGSTAAFIASAMKASGIKTGLYSSPHLISIRERIQVNGKSITKLQFSRWISEIQEKIQNIRLNQKEFACTFFEILTMVAILEFSRCKVDWVIWETGLGGRLDATNFIVPRLSVITNIDYDHTQYLGDSLELIAAEKAGIIKKGVPVVVGNLRGEALEVIRNHAAKNEAPLVEVCQTVSMRTIKLDYKEHWVEISGYPFCLGLRGSHQLENAACAFVCLQLLFSGDNHLSLQNIQQGFKTVCWPGRFHLLWENPLCIIDGAHNEAAIDRLVASWEKIFGNEPYHLVFGVLRDKNFALMSNILKKKAKAVTLIKPPTSRGLDPLELVPFFDDLKIQICSSWHDFKLSLGKTSLPILVTGSLYLIGHILVEEYGEEEEYRWNELLDG